MKSIFLEKIVLRFPKTDFRFANGFLQLLDETGSRKGGIFGFEASQEDFYPKVFLDFESEERALICDFLFSDRTQESVKIENVTGLTRKSPLSYGLLDVEAIQKRLKGSEIRILGVDHVGFNLPWFSSPLHPRIEDLRKKLADRCLYHKFPTGEPWDFILPGKGGKSTVQTPSIIRWRGIPSLKSSHLKAPPRRLYKLMQASIRATRIFRNCFRKP